MLLLESLGFGFPTNSISLHFLSSLSFSLDPVFGLLLLSLNSYFFLHNPFHCLLTLLLHLLKPFLFLSELFLLDLRLFFVFYSFSFSLLSLPLDFFVSSATFLFQPLLGLASILSGFLFNSLQLSCVLLILMLLLGLDICS